MSDLISRQAAIDVVVFECGEWTGLAKEISKQLMQLPSAQPERKTGRWEINEHTYAGSNHKNWKCTNCCTGMYDFILTSVCKPRWNYCPNCGADMRGKQE